MFKPFKIASAIVVSGALAITSFSAWAKTPKNILVVGQAIDDMVTMDPAESFEFTGNELLGQTYDRLVAYDLDNADKIMGELASSWEVSADSKTYTFNIRKGVKFASGNPLTAEDVAFSLQRVILLDKTPSFILAQFGWTKDNVKSMVQATGEYEVTLKTAKPYAPTFVLYCLTSTVAAVVDKKLLLSHEKDGDMGYAWLKTNYAGSGPFKYTKWTPNKSVTLDRNPNYWDSNAKVKRVVIRHVPETVTQQLMLEKGDLDIARNLGAEQLKQVAKNNDIALQKKSKGLVFYLGLNQKNQYLSNPDVRKALKYLVDYDGIVSTIMAGKASDHQAFLPVGFLGASTKQPYKFDVAKAKELLAKAGYPNGIDLTMDVRDAPDHKAVAQSVQSTFAKAGVNVELIPGTGKQTLTKYRARKHDIYIGYWGADYQDPHTNADTFARNPDNSDDAKFKPLAWRNAWSIPEMTKKADAALLERDGKRRAAMYQDLQDEHQMVSPFVIVYQALEVAATRKEVKGFNLGPSFDNRIYANVSK